MLRVTIELLPLGVESRKRTLGTVLIINDGSGSATRGNYDVRVLSSNGRTFNLGRVTGFPRRREGAVKLLLLALKAALGDK